MKPKYIKTCNDQSIDLIHDWKRSCYTCIENDKYIVVIGVDDRSDTNFVIEILHNNDEKSIDMYSIVPNAILDNMLGYLLNNHNPENKHTLIENIIIYVHPDIQHTIHLTNTNIFNLPRDNFILYNFSDKNIIY